MPVDWSNTTAGDLYLLLKRGIQTKLQGVMSQESEDFVFYIGETYRDEIDAAFMGAARSLIVNQGANGFIVANGEQTVTPTILSGALSYASPSDVHLEQSDSFTHTEPRPLQVTRTLLRWYDGANASGNVVGEGWRDLVEDSSNTPFERI